MASEPASVREVGNRTSVTAMPVIVMFTAGTVPSGAMSTATVESRSPQDQSDVVVNAPAADREAVAGAFARAREAAKEWRRTALARADALTAAAAAIDAAKDDVVSLMVREVGKPLTESVGEHGRAVRI